MNICDLQSTIRFSWMMTHFNWYDMQQNHYSDIIMGEMASKITSLTIVYSIAYSGADQRKHQSSMSLASVRAIDRWPVNSPHKWPVTRKPIPFDDVIMTTMKADHELYLKSSPTSPSEIILCMRPANERWPYNVTLSLIGWVHSQNDSCNLMANHRMFLAFQRILNKR